MKQRKTELVGKASADRYLKKAQEFLATAESELDCERWNSAGLSAIHSGISAADAALARTAGLRSRETDHSAVVVLLEEQVAAFSANNKRQLIGLLRLKNAVEYEDRLISRIEAVQLVDSAGRLFRWAEALVR